jgi:hypothetical protein
MSVTVTFVGSEVSFASGGRFDTASLSTLYRYGVARAGGQVAHPLAHTGQRLKAETDAVCAENS